MLLRHEELRPFHFVDLHQLLACFGHVLATIAPHAQELVEALKLLVFLEHILHVFAGRLGSFSDIYLLLV